MWTQTLWHVLVMVKHVSHVKEAMLVMLNKSCGVSKLVHMLIKINHLSHVKQAMWHFQIGTHVSQR